MRLVNLSLTAKLLLIASAGAGLALVVGLLGWISTERTVAAAEARIRDGLVAARTAELRHHCEMAVSLLAGQSAGLDQATRLERMRTLFGDVFFMHGPDGKPSGYFFAYDRTGLTLLQPPAKQVQGTNRWDFQTNGVYLIRGLAAAAARGGGTFLYHYPKPDGPVDAQGKPLPLPKLAYVLPVPAPASEPDPGWFIGIGAYVDDIDAAVAGQTTVLRQEHHARTLSTAAIAAVIAAAALALAWLVARSIARQAAVVRESLDRLAAGDLAAPPRAEGGDELGRMAASLERAVAGVRAALRSDRVDWATVERQTAARIELERQLAAAARALDGVSARLAEAASGASAQAGAMASASERLGRGMASVAAGSEEMNATIAEIARSAGEAARVATDAVALTRKAGEAAERLGASSSAIGEAAGLIAGIAEQTNLLALNATIEAARSGEHGRGFAVVASEVKALAGRTAEATAAIQRMIAGIQADTAAVREGLASSSAVVERIGAATGSIATATEEQTATTREMTRTVAEANGGVQEIAASAAALAGSAQQVNAAAGGTREQATELGRLAASIGA
jgi:methyl-accepting chemotaxis protein